MCFVSDYVVYVYGKKQLYQVLYTKQAALTYSVTALHESTPFMFSTFYS